MKGTWPATRPLTATGPRSGDMEYHGSVPYGYANSVAMLPSAQGEHVYPGLVEVLTAGS